MGHTMRYQGLTLREWIEKGRTNGTIEDVLTVIWAYRIPETEALAWVACIVSGETNEREALTELRNDEKTHELLAEIDWYSRFYLAPHRPPRVYRFRRHQ